MAAGTHMYMQAWRGQFSIVMVGVILVSLYGFFLLVQNALERHIEERAGNAPVTPTEREAKKEAKEEREESEGTQQASKDIVRSNVETLTFQTYDGAEVSFGELADLPLVVVMWASWCDICTQELQTLARIQEEYAGEVVVVAVNRREEEQSARQFTDRIGVTGKIKLWIDQDDALYQRIGGTSMPETLFFAADGTLAAHRHGPLNGETIENIVESLVASPK